MGNDSDNFIAYGFPLFLMTIFGMTLALTHKQLLSAHSSAKSTHAWLFRFSLIVTALSLFIYWSAAWAFGLVATAIAYAIALCAASNTIDRNADYLLLAQLIYMAFLIGMPHNISTGILSVVKSNNCATYYSTASDKMCKEGWLTFVMIVSGVMIGLSFMNLLIVIATKLENTAGARDDSQAPTHSSLQQPFTGGPDGTYQKVVE